MSGRGRTNNPEKLAESSKNEPKSASDSIELIVLSPDSCEKVSKPGTSTKLSASYIPDSDDDDIVCLDQLDKLEKAALAKSKAESPSLRRVGLNDDDEKDENGDEGVTYTQDDSSVFSGDDSRSISPMDFDLNLDDDESNPPAYVKEEPDDGNNQQEEEDDDDMMMEKLLKEGNELLAKMDILIDLTNDECPNELNDNIKSEPSPDQPSPIVIKDQPKPTLTFESPVSSLKQPKPSAISSISITKAPMTPEQIIGLVNDVVIPLKRIDSLSLEESPTKRSKSLKRNRVKEISEDESEGEANAELLKFMETFDETPKSSRSRPPARKVPRETKKATKTKNRVTSYKKNDEDDDDDDEEDEEPEADDIDYDDLFQTGSSPEGSPKRINKPPSAVKTLSVPKQIDFAKIESYFAGDDDAGTTKSGSEADKTKSTEYKKLLSDKHSSKPPSSTSPESAASKATSKEPLVLNSSDSNIMPLHSKIVGVKKLQTTKTSEPKPVDEREKLSSLVKSIATSEAMNKRTTLLMDANDAKRHKISPVAVAQKSSASVLSPEATTNSSPPVSPAQPEELKSPVASPKVNADAAKSSADEPSDEDEDNEQKKNDPVRDKRQICESIRERLSKSRPPTMSKAAAAAPAYLDKLKTIKSRETTQFFQNRKLPKKTPQQEMNLTQCMTMAKYEQEKRLESKQERDRMKEACRATAPGGPLSVSNLKRPPYEVLRSKSASNNLVKPSVSEATKFKVPLSTNAKQNDNNLAKKDSSSERLMQHHEISKKLELAEKKKKELQRQASKPAESERKSSASSVSSTARARESKENDLVGEIMNSMNKQAAQMNVAKRDEPQQFKQNYRVQFEEFLSCMLSWPYNWLIEQEKNTEPPPVSKEYKAMPMIDNYLVFQDYYQAMFPLLLYETWEEVTREFREMNHKKERRTYQNMPLWYKGTESYPDTSKVCSKLSILRVQTVIDSSAKSVPGEDDLLRLSYDVKTEKEGMLNITMFGIVHKIHKFRPDEAPVMQVVKEYVKTLGSPQPPKSGYSETSFVCSKGPDSSLSVYEICVLTRKQKSPNSVNIEYDCLTNLASTFRRAKALCFLQTSPICKSLLRVVFSDPIFWMNPEITKATRQTAIFSGFEEDYNESQKEVIIEASSIVSYKEPKLYLIQGPPGTGKSHTIIGIIKGIFTRLNAFPPPPPTAAATVHSSSGSSVTGFNKPAPSSSQTNFKLLICSPSNGGCDEITRRIVKLIRENKMVQYYRQNLSVVRVGRIDNMHHDCDEVNLENLAKRKCEELLHRKELERSSSHKTHHDYLRNMEKALSDRLRALNSSSSQNKTMLKDLEFQLQELKAKKRNFEAQLNKGSDKNKSIFEKRKDMQKAKEAVLKDANIIICTLNFCGNQLLDCLKPDKDTGKPLVHTIIIDEAAQCLEVECLIPLKFGCNRIILVGDPEQLPATVLSKRAQENGLAQSLFERVYQNFRFQEATPIKMLYVQYRMHPEICEFPSLNFYRGKLQTSKDIIAAREKFDRKNYLIFNVPHSAEEGDETGGSIFNPIEAEFVLELCQYSSRKNPGMSIGIITPYQRQSQHLRELLNKKKMPNVEVGTVDSYQGREKDIIILSTVRANPNKTIGFLTNRQRLNVSLTRAKFAMFIVCNLETLKDHDEWHKCFDNARKRQLIQHVQG